MIRSLIFVRHGQSTANAAGVYAGQSPHIQLTDQGRAQAVAAGKLLLRDRIDHIVSSDLDRAHETAEIIAGVLVYPIDEISINKNLREVNVGDLTGKPDLGFPLYLERVASAVDETIESPAEVEERIKPFLKSLRDYDEKTLLVVAHAGVGRILRSMLSGVPLDELAKLDVPNAVPIHLPLEHLEKFL